MQHCSCCTHNYSVISFWDPILLWVMRHNQLSLNSFFVIEVLEFIGDVLTIIFTLKSFHMLPHIFFHQCFELTKFWERLTFLLHEVDPTLSRKIINKDHIIHVLWCWSCIECSTHVWVNSLKDSRYSILLVKSGLCILPHGTSLACVYLRKSTLVKSCRNILHDLQGFVVYMAQSPMP